MSQHRARSAERTDADLIQHSPLGDQVYSLLWQRIINHQLWPGDKLSDLHLSTDLGVSRTPVREALYRLAQDGIVRFESRRGFFVAAFSQVDVREIYDLRTALEVLAVRLALPHITVDELNGAQADLDAVRERVVSGDERGSDAFLAVDRAFHQTIIRAAHNQRLQTMIGSLQAQLGVFQVYGIHFRTILERSIEHHQAILYALRQGDGTAAERAMERHIQEVKAFVLAEFASFEARGARNREANLR